MNQITLHTGESVSYGEVCRRAADLIERHGFCKEVYATRAGAYCLGGAINQIVMGDPVKSNWTEVWDLAARLEKAIGTRGGYLADWNDAPDRTGPEVCAALRHAAEEMDPA